MLIDGISLVDSSVIANSHVESGAQFPSNPKQGRMFYLSSAYNGNDVGLYIFSGSKWTTGDLTSISAGLGLTGGGDTGDISLAVDTSVIATRAFATQAISEVTTSVVPEGTNKYYTDARASAAAPVQSVAGRAGAVTLTTADVAEDASRQYHTTQRASAAAPVQTVNGKTGAVVLATTDVAEGTNKYYTDARASAAAPVQKVAGRTGLVVLSTADVAEDVSRQYHTTQRARDAAPVQTVNGKTGAVVLATTDVAEGTNKYYTDARASAAAPVQSVAGRAGAVTLTTADVAEDVSRQYHTTQRARDAAPVQSVAGRTGAVTLSTTDVAEGTNKYYTDARASAAAPVQSVAGRTGAVVLNNADIVAALGFTPVNKGGDTLTSKLVVPTPVAAGEVANKSYVDGLTVNNTSYVRVTGDQAIAGIKTFSNDVVFQGNVTISGESQLVVGETVLINDNLIELNSNFTTGVPTEDSGFVVKRGSSAEVQFVWDEANDRFTLRDGGGLGLPLYTSSSITAGSFVGNVTGNVSGTSANVTGVVAVANGGTGANSATTARTNLGLGTIATQAATNVAISGGNVNGTAIGATTASSGKFTTLAASGGITGDLTGNVTGNVTGDLAGNVTGNVSGTSANVTGVVAVVNGGTGANSAATARTNLGLGTIATQAANAVAITGGNVNGTAIGATTPSTGKFTTLAASGGITGDVTGNVTGDVTGNVSGTSANVTGVVAVVNGGTGANSAATARTNLGLGTISTQAASAVAITGGNVNGTAIGATTPSTGKFTTLAASGGITGDVTGNVTGDLTGNVTGNVSGTSANVTGVVAVVNGGTGANSAATARTNLGLGTIATQAASAVAITGGNVNGTAIGATTPSTGKFTTVTATGSITGDLTGNVTGNVSGTSANVTGVVAVANGGTGANSAATARTNLGLGTIATQAADAVAIAGGSVNGTAIGATTPSTGKFTTLAASGITSIANGSAAAPGLSFANDTNTGIYLVSADVLGISTGGTESIRVEADGDTSIVGHLRRGIAVGLTAAGTTQATGLVLGKDINVVATTAANTGVVLPIAVAGMTVTVINEGANTLNVYPATNASIDSGAVNTAFALGSGARLQFVAASATKWYSLTGVYA